MVRDTKKSVFFLSWKLQVAPIVVADGPDVLGFKAGCQLEEAFLLKAPGLHGWFRAMSQDV